MKPDATFLSIINSAAPPPPPHLSFQWTCIRGVSDPMYLCFPYHFVIIDNIVKALRRKQWVINSSLVILRREACLSFPSALPSHPSPHFPPFAYPPEYVPRDSLVPLLIVQHFFCELFIIRDTILLFWFCFLQTFGKGSGESNLVYTRFIKIFRLESADRLIPQLCIQVSKYLSAK